MSFNVAILVAWNEKDGGSSAVIIKLDKARNSAEIRLGCLFGH